MQQEQPAQHRQVVNIVNDKAFITTQVLRTDINGNEFVTFESTQPYEGSLEKYKEELETIKLKETEKLNTIIADAEAKIAEVDAVLTDSGKIDDDNNAKEKNK